MHKVTYEYGDAVVSVTTDSEEFGALEVITRVALDSLLDIIAGVEEYAAYQAEEEEEPTGLSYREAMERDYLLDGVNLPEKTEDDEQVGE
jgi:hypothetical protein